MGRGPGYAAWGWVVVVVGRGKVGLIRIRMIEVHPRVHVYLLSCRFSVPFSEIIDKNDPSTFDVRKRLLILVSQQEKKRRSLKITIFV